MLGLLEPSSLEDRVRVYVTAPPSNLEERDGTVVDVSLERLEKFAAATMDCGEVKQVINALSSGHHSLAFSYGQRVAEMTVDLPALAEFAIDAYRTAAPPRNELALTGMIQVIADRDPELRQLILQRIAGDKTLAPALPLLSSQPRFLPEDVRRLIGAYRDGMLEQEPSGMPLSGSACQISSHL